MTAAEMIENPVKSGFWSSPIWLECFVLIGFFMLIFWPDRNAADAMSVIFISIMLEALPFMLVGSLIGGLLEVFVSRERLIAILPRQGWLTILLAGGLGVIFPVCECAIVPVVKRLIGKGLPPAAAVAFLLGVPIANPLVFGSTALAYRFDWEVAGLRVLIGYLIAVSIGLLFGWLYRNRNPIRSDEDVHRSNARCDHAPLDSNTIERTPVSKKHSHTCSCGCHHADVEEADTMNNHADYGLSSKLLDAVRHAIHDLMSVGHYLVIGAFVAALAQTFISRSTFAEMGSSAILPVFLMVLLAFLLNLCSEADAFIAASFQGLIPLPAQMAFMLTGPVLDLKLLLMYQSIFKKRTIVLLAAIILSFVCAASILLTLVWRA